MSEKDMPGTEVDELESADNWDFERAESHLPSKSNRVVVSVSIPRPVFDEISKAADRAGLRVSEFIREGAREKSAQRATVPAVGVVSGTFSGVITAHGNVRPMTSTMTRVTGARSPAVDTVGKQSGFVNEPTTV